MNQRQILEGAAAKLRAAGIEEADNDAWLLMSEAFGISRTEYYMHCDEEYCDFRNIGDGSADSLNFYGSTVKCSRISLYNEMIERRCRREPLQYILGKAYFMGYEFKVTPDVLIPRFDTEILVEETLKHIKAGDCILDMCTGSGCIAVSIDLEMKKRGNNGLVKITAADISEAALAVAGQNSAALGAGPIEFMQSDMYGNVKGKYNIIVSNPPYIPSQDIDALEPEVKVCEPAQALDGGADGLLYYRILAGESGKYLYEGGYLLMETGYNQAEAVSRMLEQNNYADIRVIRDLAGLDRVVCGRRI